MTCTKTQGRGFAWLSPSSPRPVRSSLSLSGAVQHAPLSLCPQKGVLYMEHLRTRAYIHRGVVCGIRLQTCAERVQRERNRRREKESARTERGRRRERGCRGRRGHVCSRASGWRRAWLGDWFEVSLLLLLLCFSVRVRWRCRALL